jgi:SAM-dependent methyltransferase
MQNVLRSSALPKLASRADTAHMNFVESFREYIKGSGANFEVRLNEALVAEGRRRGRDFSDGEDVRRFLQSTTLGPLRDRLARTQMEMQWNVLWRSLDEQREALERELEEWSGVGPGTLALDPDFVVPPYLNVEFHIQPGGYHKDTLSGFLYHYGTTVFYRLGDDPDGLHGKIVGAVPRPADGRVSRVLDLACSIGQSSTALKRRFPESEVWAIDYSAPMLRAAHRRAAIQEVDINFKQALAEATGFPDDHFDVTFAFILFHELPLRITEAVLKEVARVTRKGGVFVVYDFGRSKDMTPWQHYHRWFDARHNNEPYSQEFCDCDFDALLAKFGFTVTRNHTPKGSAGSPRHYCAINA